MMHLVFVTSIVPDGAPATGYEIANEAVISSLRRAGVRMTILGFTWPGSRPSDLENTIVLGSVDVRTDNASGPQKARWVANAIRLGLPVTCAKLRVVEPGEVISALRSIEPFDGFVLNAVAMPGAFEQCFAGKPSIYVGHNVEHQSARENAKSANSAIQRVLFEREARLLKDIENRLCRNASHVFTFAQDDLAMLGLDPDRSDALPLTTRKSLPKPRKPQEIIFDCSLIGTWTWQPNRVGLEWFLDNVVPLLAGRITIAIAGNAPHDLKDRYPGVNWVGRVDDAAQFVRSGAVVPLVSRAGTGVQLKTIETFELGLPSVATRHSVRGIGAVPQNCHVTDDAREFAVALLSMSTKARSGTADLDGAGFLRRQREELDKRVEGALAGIAARRLREAV